MILDLAIILGTVLTLLKGAELLLRPHQRKAVQVFLEDVTLKVDNLNFAEAAQRMSSPEAQFSFLFLSYVQFTVLTVVVLLVQALLWKSDMPLQTAFGPNILYWQLGTLALCYATLALSWRWPLPALMKWIVGSATRKWIVVIRFLAFLLAGYAFFGLYQFMLASAFPDNRTAVLIGITVVYPIFIIFFVLLQSIAAMLQAKSRAVRWQFAFVRGLMWRIVEYDKGAVAAIILLTTIVLTLYKELLK